VNATTTNPTQLYAVINKARFQMLVFARDQDDARDIARKRGHVRSPAGVVSVEDVSQLHLDKDVQAGNQDTMEIMASGARGAAARTIAAMSGTAFMNMLTGAAPEPKDPVASNSWNVAL
jgi:hypothetical protein